MLSPTRRSLTRLSSSTWCALCVPHVWCVMALMLCQAGQVTTTVSISLAIMELSMHPEILEKMHQEVVSVCGLEGEVTWEHVHELKYVLLSPYDLYCFNRAQCRYIDQVVKETLRKWPTVPMFERELEEPEQVCNVWPGLIAPLDIMALEDRRLCCTCWGPRAIHDICHPPQPRVLAGAGHL